MAAQLHFGTGDSVAFGTTGSDGATSASFSTSSLTNLRVGDLLVAWIHNQNGSNADATITPPSGWTQYGAAIGSPSVSASRTTGFYYYPINTSADISNLPGTLTWTFKYSARVGCVVARATGIDLTDIEDSAATSFTNDLGVGTFDIAGITTVNADTLLVGGYFHENSAGTTSPSTTSFMTAFQEYRSNPDGTLANTGAVLGYQTMANAGATGDITAQLDNSATTLGGELVAFKASASTGGGTTPPAIVGTPTTFISNPAVTSFTIDTPTGLQDGDVLVMALSGQSPTATSDYGCSGWSRISQPFIASSGGYRITAFYALPVPTAADVMQTSFTFTSGDSATGGRVAAEMFIVRGADLTNLTDGYSAYAGSGGTQTVSVSPPNPTVDNDLLLTTYNAQCVSGVDYTIASGPSGMTQQQFLVTSTNSVSKTMLGVYQQTVNAGGVGSKTVVWNGAVAQASGVSVAIRPLGAVTPNPGIGVHYTSDTDTLSSGNLFYTSATDTLSTPLEVRPVPTGYTSVSAMLAASPFYVAHRGGSADWPEMSLHAYTQSVFWGVGAVELSLARTSDGVWFGLHDSSLDRTSLNKSGQTTLLASNLTWAQVQAYQIQYPTNIANASSLPQPYMRWEEIIDAYYGTHVIFVDPKYASNFVDELLGMMDALPGTPTDHFVGKSFGQTGNVQNTTGFPQAAAAHGYKNWGYFYETDYENGNLATYQARYDILGMDYTATSAAWTAVMSYGKPVIGHIVPTATAANTALAYGADGLMVSGVQEVVPRSQNPAG